MTIASIAEDAGIAALAVHGRTRACAFKGEVEYDTIAAIVAATDFPVFANGDIDSPKAAAGDRLHRCGWRHDRPSRPGQALAVRPDRHSPGHRHHTAAPLRERNSQFWTAICAAARVLRRVHGRAHCPQARGLVPAAPRPAEHRQQFNTWSTPASSYTHRHIFHTPSKEELAA